MTEAHDGTIRRLDLPFTLSASGSDLAVFGREEEHSAYAVACGYTLDGEECAARFTLRGIIQYIVGYPNEEAYWRDPRGEIGHGMSEIVGSSWSNSIDAYNLTSFGTPYPSLASRQPRHFFLGSKDVSAQFLARDIELDIHHSATLRVAYAEAVLTALHHLGIDPTAAR